MDMNKSVYRLMLIVALGSLMASACAPVSGSATPPEPSSPLATPGSSGPSSASSGPTSGPVEAPDPARGRDAALVYLSQHYGLEMPRDPGWDEEVITPENLVGSHAVEYSASGWDGKVQVSMPVVAPQHVVYTVLVENPETGFHWEGKVDARGNVTETAGAEGESAAQASEKDLQILAAGNRAFAFDLYQALRGEEGNLFFSPFSISAALAMTYAGARGETGAEMADTLHFSLPQERLHPAFNGLDQKLAARGEGTQEQSMRPGESEDGFQLHVANTLWGQTGYSFLPEFLDLLAHETIMVQASKSAGSMER